MYALHGSIMRMPLDLRRQAERTMHCVHLIHLFNCIRTTTACMINAWNGYINYRLDSSPQEHRHEGLTYSTAIVALERAN